MHNFYNHINDIITNVTFCILGKKWMIFPYFFVFVFVLRKSHYGTQVSFKLPILLLLLPRPQAWDCRCESPNPASAEISKKKLNSTLRPGWGSSQPSPRAGDRECSEWLIPPWSSLLFLHPTLFLQNKAIANTVNETLSQGAGSRPGRVLRTMA